MPEREPLPYRFWETLIRWVRPYLPPFNTVVAESTDVDLPVPGKPGGVQNSWPGFRMSTGRMSSNVLVARSVAGFAGNAGRQAGPVVVIIKCAGPGCMDEAGVPFQATGRNGSARNWPRRSDSRGC